MTAFRDLEVTFPGMSFKMVGAASVCLLSAVSSTVSTVSAITIPFPCTMRGVPAISNVTYYDSKVAEGSGTYVSGARFYNSSNVGFSVTGFDVSADL